MRSTAARHALLPGPARLLVAISVAVIASGSSLVAAPHPPVPGKVVVKVPRPPVPQHLPHPTRAKVVVKVAPPPVRVVVPPPAPHPGHVWVEGYWRWEESANDYLWEDGVWVAPPSGMHTWVPGHWKKKGRGGWIWVDGHWR